MKGYEKVKELVEHEIGEYGYFEVVEIKVDDRYDVHKNTEYYEVELKVGHSEDKVKSLYFKYDKVNEVLKIEVGEDTYEVVEEYTWRVKYFWMTLLEW